MDTTPIWLSAAGSLSASAIALFGPAARRWWFRARLDLERDDDVTQGDLQVSLSDTDRATQKPHTVSLLLTNHGRGQADDVEALLEVQTPLVVEGAWLGLLPSVTLGVLRFELAETAATVVRVPRGATRRLRLLKLGTGAQVRGVLETEGEEVPKPEVDDKLGGMFVVWPSHGVSRSLAIFDGTDLYITVTLTASNLKARAWRGKARVDRIDMGPMEKYESFSTNELVWIDELRPSHGGVRRTPLRRWIHRRSPRRWWQQRELARLTAGAAEELDRDRG